MSDKNNFGSVLLTTLIRSKDMKKYIQHEKFIAPSVISAMSQDLGDSLSPEPAYKDLAPAQQRERLQELAIVFLKLGSIAFGGPAAHIAMIDDEVVKRRQWLTRQQLLDLIGVTNLIPGPNSTELAIHIGLERGGWRGLIVAGVSFILPAMLIVWALAALYAQYQTVPQLEWMLYGIKPVIIAIVIQALWKLGKSAIKNIQTSIAVIAVIILFFLGINEILLLIVAGVVVAVVNVWRSGSHSSNNSLILLPTGIFANLSSANLANVSTKEPASWSSLFLVFLKIGSVMYGGGYVLLAFLQKDIVERYHWLTSQQLLDAVAIGQFTPGPLFTTATFVGYLAGGNLGAIAATIGIFLPAFGLIALVNPLVPKLRKSPWTAGFLDGVNAASLGLMAVVTYELGRATLLPLDRLDWFSIDLAVISCVIVFRFKLNSAYLVLGGGAIGLCYRLFF